MEAVIKRRVERQAEERSNAASSSSRRTENTSEESQHPAGRTRRCSNDCSYAGPASPTLRVDDLENSSDAFFPDNQGSSGRFGDNQQQPPPPPVIIGNNNNNNIKLGKFVVLQESRRFNGACPAF